MKRSRNAKATRCTVAHALNRIGFVIGDRTTVSGEGVLCLPPRILQRHRPVEHRRPCFRIDPIRDEVTMPFELEGLLRHGVLQRGFQLRADDFHRIGVEVVEEVAGFGAGLRGPEQAVVEAHFGFDGVRGAQPVDVALDLDRVGAGRAGFGVGQVVAVHGDDVAVGVLVAAGALDDVAVAQAHRVAYNY